MHLYYVKNNKLISAIALYIFLYGTLQWIRPKWLFTTQGEILQFGVGNSHKTIFPIWLLAILLGILSYITVNQV